MSASDRLLAIFAQSRHPRLLILSMLGVTIGLLGTAITLTDSGPDGASTLGVQIAVVGYLTFLVGTSGYVAFSVFKHGFD